MYIFQHSHVRRPQPLTEMAPSSAEHTGFAPSVLVRPMEGDPARKVTGLMGGVVVALDGLSGGGCLVHTQSGATQVTQLWSSRPRELSPSPGRVGTPTAAPWLDTELERPSTTS